LKGRNKLAACSTSTCREKKSRRQKSKGEKVMKANFGLWTLRRFPMNLGSPLHWTWFVIFTSLLTLFLTSPANAGTLIYHEIESPAIAKNIMGISSKRRIAVYLPDGYDQGNQRYPVIYWIPGWMQQLETYNQALDAGIRSGKVAPAIAVFIDVSEGTVFLNSAEFGNWGDFLAKELVPFIDKTYSTIPNWRRRALMGLSMGGYSALMLPLLYPNTWGAVGLNDAFVSTGYYELHIDEPVVPDATVERWRSFYKNPPENLEGYWTASNRILIQLGVAISPNPAAPLHFDPPIDKEGKIVPDVIEKWLLWCPMDAAMIVKYRNALRNLLMLAVIVVEAPSPAGSNRGENLIMLKEMDVAGVPYTRLDMPGGHTDFREERFVALAEVILNAMMKAEVTPMVSPKGKLTTTWCAIKTRR
jgi:pimeloyl-ACP methyl ester carboxylesterase